MRKSKVSLTAINLTEEKIHEMSCFKCESDRVRELQRMMTTKYGPEFTVEVEEPLNEPLL